MKKALVFVVMLSSISAQAGVLSSVSGRINRFLAPSSPSFANAYPCGRTQVFVDSDSSEYTSTRSTVVCEGRIKKLNIIRTNAEGSVETNDLPISRSAYTRAKPGSEFKALIQNGLLGGAELSDDGFSLVDFRISSRVISGVAYRIVSVKVELADEGEKVGFAEMEFAAGLPRGEELISYNYAMDMGQLGGSSHIGTITELSIPAAQR